MRLPRPQESEAELSLGLGESGLCPLTSAAHGHSQIWLSHSPGLRPLDGTCTASGAGQGLPPASGNLPAWRGLLVGTCASLWGQGWDLPLWPWAAWRVHILSWAHTHVLLDSLPCSGFDKCPGNATQRPGQCRFRLCTGSGWGLGLCILMGSRAGPWAPLPTGGVHSGASACSQAEPTACLVF